MTLEALAIAALFAAFLASCFRARWVALAIAPPVLLILARLMGLVDISSASHPLRVGTALLGLSLAMWAASIAARAQRQIAAWPHPLDSDVRAMAALAVRRKLAASILVFASDCTDVPALFTWQIPGVWVVVPLQIAVCTTICFVLLAPERWLPRWLQ